MQSSRQRAENRLAKRLYSTSLSAISNTITATCSLIGMLLFFLIGAGPNASAQPIEIIIGTSTGYPPFYYSEGGKLKGICPEVINHVFGELNLKPVYQQYPWNRMISSAQIGKVDAIMPLFKNPKREAFLHFSDNRIAEETNQIFIHTNSAVKDFVGYEALSPKKIGTVKNYSYGTEFDENTDLIKMEFFSDEALIKAIYNRRIDFAIGNQKVVTYKARLMGFNVDELRFLLPVVTEASLYIGFSRTKHHEELSEAFSRKLSEFKTSSEYKAILSRY